MSVPSKADMNKLVNPAWPRVKHRLFNRVEEIFSSLSDKRAFIFGSGCCPTPKANYENLLILRDACWEYGQFA